MTSESRRGAPGRHHARTGRRQAASGRLGPRQTRRGRRLTGSGQERRFRPRARRRILYLDKT
ncbi:hypothetical protein AJ78_07784, partial [Emergomyces pasteurianus Ep9510]